MNTDLYNMGFKFRLIVLAKRFDFVGLFFLFRLDLGVLREHIKSKWLFVLFCVCGNLKSLIGLTIFSFKSIFMILIRCHDLKMVRS